MSHRNQAGSGRGIDNWIGTALLIALFSIPVCAQAPDPNPEATMLRYVYNISKRNILGSAERMPAEFYGMRPGSQTEVRTFGQQVLHAAEFSYLWCSQAKGEKNPNPGISKLTGKAEIIKAASDAFAYCDPIYAGLTDATGAELVDSNQEDGRPTRMPRLSLLTLHFGHNYEVYGSMAVYLRIKNIGPPASDPKPAKKQ